MDIKIWILLCTIYFPFTQVQCATHPNNGRNLGCWPLKLWYETFEVKFYFSSRNEHAIPINVGTNFRNEHIDYDPKRKTIVVVHGLIHGRKESKMKTIRKRLLEWKDVNVIVVRWGKGCDDTLKYPQAAANTEYAADRLKELIVWIRSYFLQQGLPMGKWSNIYFIGFSLGAHVCGQAAERLRVEENLLIDRITGLDPAEPCFEDADNPLRLSKNNAKLVDIIHTDGARRRNSAFGILEPIGHVDFYVNGGVSDQPGCQSGRRSMPTWGSVINFAFEAYQHIESNGPCSHSRVVQVFIDSIKYAWTNCQFYGYRWQLGTEPAKKVGCCTERTCPQMGVNADRFKYYEPSNIFYVYTRDQTPFCEIYQENCYKQK